PRTATNQGRFCIIDRACVERLADERVRAARVDGERDRAALERHRRKELEEDAWTLVKHAKLVFGTRRRGTPVSSGVAAGSSGVRSSLGLVDGVHGIGRRFARRRAASKREEEDEVREAEFHARTVARRSRWEKGPVAIC